MIEEQYLFELKNILQKGTPKAPARPGMPTTIELWGVELRSNLRNEFPLLTTKQMPFKTVMRELLWILSGDTNVKTLIQQGVEIWTGYAYKYYVNTHKYKNDVPLSFEAWYDEVKNNPNTKLGSCGKIYGKQWRQYGWGHKFDQVKNVIKSLKETPDARYHIISAWDPISFLMKPERAALPSCPVWIQFSVRQGTYLDAFVLQRSADMFLGVPFDLASYAALTHIIAAFTGYKPGEFVWYATSAHIYSNHLEQVYEQLDRAPFKAPTLKFTKPATLKDITLHNFELSDYTSHGKIKGDLAVGI